MFQENEQIELKKSTSELNEAMKSISAILNKHGNGTLYFGINDKGVAVGQQISDSTLRDISRKIYETIKPQIFPIIKKVIIEEKEIIEVSFTGDEMPYSASGRYYMRIADEDREMSPQELVRMIQNKANNKKWEETLTEYGIDEVDDNTFYDFYKRAVSCGRIPDEQYDKQKQLEKLGLLRGNKLNNAGYYLFSKNRPVIVKYAIFATDQKLTFLDIKRFEGNIMNAINESISYIQRNIRWRVEILAHERLEIPEVPIRALREIVINSFAHACYYANTEHEIDIHPNKIVIYNPGQFPSNYVPEDFANNNLQSIIRNPLILNILYKCHDVETYGSGFKRTYELCDNQRVQCLYEKYDEGFSFIFSRKEDLIQSAMERQDISMSDIERMVIEIIKNDETTSREEIADKINKSTRTVQRYLDSLKSKGILSRIGSPSKGYWEITKR